MTANHAVAASSSSAPKPAPYRQGVAAATADDDDPRCALHPQTMSNLSISDGDVVLLKSKRRREKRCTAVSDEGCPKHKLKISKAVRSDLRVGLTKSDVVFVYPCRDVDAKHGGRRPVGVTDGGLARGLFKALKEHGLMCLIFVMLVLALYFA